MKRSTAVLFFVALCCVAALVAFAYVRRAGLWVLDSAGPIAGAERDLIIESAVLCAVIVVPVIVLLFVFAWRYRAGSAAAEIEHHPNWDHDSWAAEFFWWLVPSIIIFTLAVIGWRATHLLDPYHPIASTSPPLTVQVVALDWKWLFLYPQEGIASVNMAELPVGVPVHFELTADAPMNSFWVPQLGGQIMVMPGMVTQLYLEADRPGVFSGSSANISGEGFAGMAFTVRAVPQDAFSAWVAGVTASSTPLSSDAYRELRSPSVYNSVMTFSSTSPDLFSSIVGSYLTTTSPSVE